MNIIIFLHFHKAGGSTINSLFSNYNKHNTGTNGNPWINNKIIPFWNYKLKEFNHFKKYLLYKNINFICFEWNFFKYYNQINYSNTLLITCFRDPYERFKSNMNYDYETDYKKYNSKNIEWTRKNVNQKFYVNYNKFNYYVKMLNGFGDNPCIEITEKHLEIAKKNLSKFKTIIILEYITSFKLLEIYNIKYKHTVLNKNDNKKDINISYDEFYLYNKYDYDLYNYAIKLSNLQYNLYHFYKLNIYNKILYYIHIPKTAGSSIDSKQIIKLGHGFNIDNVYRTPSWKGGWDGYTTEYYKKYEYPIIEHNKITIIRNPFDLLCSYYFHGHKLKPNNEYCHSGWGAVNYTHQFKSFKEFINAYCSDTFEWHQPIFKQFLYSQLFDYNHNCVAHIIIKYEYLKEAIANLNLKLKYPIKLNNYNKSRYKIQSYKDYYDSEMILKVSKKCEKELKYFNYDFNGSTIYEPFIFNSPIKYDIKNNNIYY